MNMKPKCKLLLELAAVNIFSAHKTMLNFEPVDEHETTRKRRKKQGEKTKVRKRQKIHKIQAFCFLNAGMEYSAAIKIDKCRKRTG